MDRLQARVQPYAWGSRTELARLTGRPYPTDEPEAELWMGAHEAAPCSLERDGHATTLDAVIVADPQRELGAQVAQRFDGRLPFLLKVLAPEQALSIQAHPDARQASEAPDGTYGDDWPKPEALLALTDFEVFAGSRSFEQVRALASRLVAPGLAALVEECATEADPAAELLRRLLDDGTSLVDEVVAAARRAPDDDPDAALLDAVSRVAHQRPGDVGAVVLLTMEHRVLAPGEFLHVPAGVLHAYVRGVAVEILANSDNVVRAGLTDKRIDIQELLRIVDVHQAVIPLEPEVDADEWSVFPARTPFFRLRTRRLGERAVQLPGHGSPRVLLVLDGGAELAVEGESLRLQQGECCFLPASSGPVVLTGGGTAYLASPGDLDHD